MAKVLDVIKPDHSFTGAERRKKREKRDVLGDMNWDIVREIHGAVGCGWGAGHRDGALWARIE